jgi:hypothetical protein
MNITVTLSSGIAMTLGEEALRAMRSGCQEPRRAGARRTPN